jgi:hypothetical protein
MTRASAWPGVGQKALHTSLAGLVRAGELVFKLAARPSDSMQKAISFANSIQR